MEDVSLHLGKHNDPKMKVDVHVANSILCFNIQGLSTSYHLLVAYFFCKPLSGKELYSLTLAVMKEMESIGFLLYKS